MRLPKEPDHGELKVTIEPDEILAARRNGEITAKEGESLFIAYLKKEFPEAELKKMMKDLARASDLKYSMGAGFYETPNWNARRDALRDILKMLKHMDKDESTRRNAVPAKITFNVINGQKTEKVIDVEKA